VELPQFDGMQTAARYLPGAGGREVGGDFYVGHGLADGRVLLIIGDVMGHGARAAARMGQLRAVLTAFAFEGDAPERVLGRLAASTRELLDLPMATTLVAVYDPRVRRLTAASAGHLPPLLAPPQRPPSYVGVRPGPPLGVGGGVYVPCTIDVPPSSTVVLYTDGLIEDRTKPIDAGLERLRAALEQIRLPPEAVCDHVLRELGRADGAEDDIALLVFSHLDG
jgi:serine phosphatase RsbU (regulator of sigma subunit)